MSILGFQEACDHSDAVQIQERPSIYLSVASPPGMAILKTIAWTDRSREHRGKDARDLLHLLYVYERIPAISDSLYEDLETMERFDWNPTTAAAFLLGRRAAEIAAEQTKAVFHALAEGTLEGRNIEELIDDMQPRADQYQQVQALVDAYLRGIISL